MPIELPKSKKTATQLSPDILLLYGLPKVGKTEALSQLDDCLIEDLEKGTNRYDAMAVQANTYQEYQELLIALATEYQKNGSKYLYKYGAIDTLDILEDFAVHKAAEIYKMTPMGKSWYAQNYVSPGVLRPDGDYVTSLPKGAGWLYVRDAMKYYVDINKKFFERLILIGHVKDKTLETPKGEVTFRDISLSGKLPVILGAKADAIGYLYRNKDSKLMVSFKTNEGSTMGTRSKRLAGTEFEFDWSKIFFD